MQLKNLICSILLFSILSCTDEPNLNNYNVSIRNISNKSLIIKGFNEKKLILNKTLSNEEKIESCKYSAEAFSGYNLTYCGIDSITFQFDNDKGYISTHNRSGNYNVPSNRNPLWNTNGYQTNGNDYEFIITQEDFENAHNLP